MSHIAGRDTIFALSSGKLPSGVAVIRVSGPEAAACLSGFVGALPEPRKAALRNLFAKDGRILDSALALWFPAPASFTGEDCVEFQCHGGPAVVAAIMTELGERQGCRVAEAGEFSLRAFSNGKADLTQMEALADLIEAQTEVQRALALAQASGAQRKLYSGWRADMLRARAYLEADLDFSDEEDVPGSVADAVRPIVSDLAVEIALHLKTYQRAEMIREGFRVVIAGPPNAGKSTLLNTLAERDVAIVTDIAGTTRDVLDVHIDLGGLKVVISDTAGLRQTTDVIEMIGIERARSAIDSADLVLVLSEDHPATVVRGGPVWQIQTKCDDGVVNAAGFDFAISCRTGFGIERLISSIGDLAEKSIGDYSDGLLVGKFRHVALLQSAYDALDRFLALNTNCAEFGAEELRIASDSLGSITGVIGAEDVLGAIFSSFCIGK